MSMASAAATPHHNYKSDSYEAKVRKNLLSFHKNLSNGNYHLNGPLVALDVHWNYDGALITGRAQAIAALGAVASSGPLRGLQVTDMYAVADGSVGMTLYAIRGNLSGSMLPGVQGPLREGARFDVLGAERFVFHRDGLLRDLVTVDQFGRIAEQVQASGDDGEAVPASAIARPRLVVSSTPETAVTGYRELVRGNLEALHKNVNEGNPEANRGFAVGEDVVVSDNGVVRNGTQAFVELMASRGAGLGAFPDKTFHDFYVVADGNLGAVEYVWQGPQRWSYRGIEVKEGAQVRVRGMLFFELDAKGLVIRVTGVHDEAHVGAQLAGRGGYLYP